MTSGFPEKMKMMLLMVFASLALRTLAQAQDNPGFMNIDCGSSKSYRDTTLGINYATDEGFVETGQNLQISSTYFSHVQLQQLTTLRNFPNGTRNCYTLRPEQGKNNKYLIRASFSYGNYDGTSQSPTFDVYIDVNYWTTLSPSTYTYQEIIYTPTRDYIQVCLVNRGRGTPFISALELRLLENSTYVTSSSEALVLYARNNIGSTTAYRYPQDDYDRIWQGQEYQNGLFTITNTTGINLTSSNDAYKVPTEVLMTAQQTNDSTSYWYQFWKPLNSTSRWYIYLHFAELQVLQAGQVRSFKVYVQGNILRTVIPEYLKPVTVESLPVSGSTIMYNISSTSDANLPPFLNAVEIYYATDLVNSQTDLDDVNAIMDIKSTYRVIKDSWQGDPCAPRDFIWSGLNCSQDISPRITSLNLSSSGLTGTIVASLSNLTALVSLDLSFNQLTGQLPEFLAQMPNLRILNLSGNNLEGPIPNALKKKVTAGTMQISLAGNPLCQTDSCSNGSGETKKKNVVVPVVIAVVASLLVLVVLSVLIFYIRAGKRRQGAGGGRSSEDARSLMSTGAKETTLGIGKITRAYISSEVSSITQRFNVTIGHGGFGSVFLGALSDGTKVAVKVLSQSSKQGYKEFQAEAQLLMIVHHKNLVSLLGYCDEIESMALIYELMPNGNLRQKLSDNNINVLRWDQRLQIAIDAAQGLEYLHNGCKPPIVHRDLKTTNILLDENMQAKIADFGLSRFFKPDNHESYISTMPAGTPGYLDPAFHSTATLNKKSDLYSFGIILLELITGHPAIIRNPKSSVHIVQWVTPLIEAGDVQSIVEPRIHGQFNSNSVWKVIEIAVKCVDITPNRRPDINWVLSELKESLAIETNSRRGQGTDSSYQRSNSFEMTSLEIDLPMAR